MSKFGRDAIHGDGDTLVLGNLLFRPEAKVILTGKSRRYCIFNKIDTHSLSYCEIPAGMPFVGEMS